MLSVPGEPQGAVSEDPLAIDHMLHHFLHRPFLRCIIVLPGPVGSWPAHCASVLPRSAGLATYRCLPLLPRSDDRTRGSPLWPVAARSSCHQDRRVSTYGIMGQLVRWNHRSFRTSGDKVCFHGLFNSVRAKSPGCRSVRRCQRGCERHQSRLPRSLSKRRSRATNLSRMRASPPAIRN